MKRLLLVMTFLTLTLSTFAESSNILSYYDSELFKITFKFMGGLSLGYRGQTTNTNFGISKYFKDSLSVYPDTKSLIDSYSKKNLAGNIFLFGGLGLTMVGAYYPLLVGDSITEYSNYYDKYKTTLWLAIGGIISELIGTFLLPSSYQDLTEGVNLFNRHKIEEFK